MNSRVVRRHKPNPGRYTPPTERDCPLPACYRTVNPLSLRCVIITQHTKGCSGLPLIMRRGMVIVKQVPGLKKGEICLPIR